MTNSAVNVLAPSLNSSLITQGTVTIDAVGTASTLSNPKVVSASSNPSSSGSLLDDEDKNETARLGLGAVLQLVTGSSPVSVVKTGAQAKKED